MAKNLGGLAALAALGYMASKMGDKGDVPTGAAYEDKVPQAKLPSDNFDKEIAAQEAFVNSPSGPADVKTPSATSRPAAKSKPVAKSFGAGRGGQGGPTAAELQAYASRGSGRGGQGGPTADELQKYRSQQEMKRLQEYDKPLENVYPEQMLGGGAGFGLKSLHGMAKNLANRGTGKTLQTIEQQALPAPAKSLGQQALPSPTPRLPYDKAGAVNRAREARAAERNEEMLRENASRYGLDPDNINPATASVIRQNLGGKDFSLGMKRGGMVKKMAKGGMTSMPKASSASRRADGIATKGKTKGTMIMCGGGMTKRK